LNANSFNALFRNGGYVANPAIPATPNVSYALTLQGALVGLQPQKATDWSIGADIDVPFAPGLRVGASYYNIDFRGALGKPPLTGNNPNVPSLLANYPGALIYNPTAADLQAAFGQVSNPEILAAFQALNPAAQLYVLQDFRTRNLSNSKIAGIDFSASYFRSTGFGSIDARVAGNVRVTNESQLSDTLPFTDGLLDGNSLWNVTASVGATVGVFRGQATLNHSAGYDIASTSINSATNPGGTTLQARVGSFNVVNLFLSYDLKQKFLGDSLQFTLNINNLLDASPPILRTTNGGVGTANGQTLGRIFQLGVRAKF
jgi:iron complex outermembrane receptor protein